MDQGQELRAIWGTVVEHLPRLRRIARGMASVDRRLDAADLLQDAIADIVDAQARGVYDPARGPWIVWARTRVWLSRTRQIRALAREEPRGRVALGPTDEDGQAFDPALAPGSDGHHDRALASVEASQLFGSALPEERDAILVAAQGLDPALVGGARVMRETLDDFARSR